MSSEGSAAVVVVPVGVVLAPAAIAAAAAIGAVIVVAKGAMWVGEQVHARYVARCASWAEAERELIALSGGNLVSLEEFQSKALTDMLRYAATQPANDGTISAQRQQELEHSFAQALTAAQAATPVSISIPETSLQGRELDRARSELALDVFVARQQGIPAQIVGAAESALSGDLAQVNGARVRLKQAWAEVGETQRLRAGQREEATIRLAMLKGTISAIREQRRSGAQTITPEQQSRLAQIESEMGKARTRLTDSPELVRLEAERLQGELSEVERAIMFSTSAAHDAGAGQRAEVAKLKGRLRALRKLVDEVETYHYATPGTWRKQLADIETALASATPQLSTLTAQIADLERDAFKRLDHGQQRALAGQIAEVMAQQGFHQDVDGLEAITIDDLGDGAHRVVGLRNDAKGDEDRQDRMVTFTLEANGQLTYDFAGYVGDECHGDMRAIFEGLRKRGIIITDNRRLPGGSTQLSDEQAQALPGPQVITNKEQAVTASAVLAAFHQMGYSDDQITVSSMGPQIHLSASASGMGYYEFGLDTHGDVTQAEYDGSKPRVEAMDPVLRAIGAQQQEADSRALATEPEEQRAKTTSKRKRNAGYIRSGNALQQ